MELIHKLDRSAALTYIKKRGYVSYNSLKLYRDGEAPGEFKGNLATDIGGEVHSRFLEKIVTKKKFDPATEKLINDMVKALEKDRVTTSLMKDALVEQEFDVAYMGIRLFGYIDILPPAKLVGDLKTFSGPAKHFISRQDFLQAAVYLAVTGRDDFYYIGISKDTLKVTTHRASKYPSILKASTLELKYLLKQLDKDL